MTPGAALREVRAGRDKAAFYREMHLRVRAGVGRTDGRTHGRTVPFEAALLKLGEESGTLEQVTRLLADYFAAEDRAVLTVLKRATYPMFVALAAAAIGPLPILARGHPVLWILATASGLTLWFLAGGALLMGTVHRHLSKPKFVLGRLLRALTIAIETGLPTSRAAELAAAASGSDLIAVHVRGVGARAAATQSLADTFRGCPLVPFTAIAAMEVADASGDYGNTLRRLAELTES